MRPLLFISALLFCCQALAIDANLVILDHPESQNISAGSTLRLKVIPTETITGNFQHIKLLNTPSTSTTTARMGPLLIDLRSFVSSSGAGLQIGFEAMLTQGKEVEIPPLQIELSSDNSTPIILATKAHKLTASSNLQPGDEQNPDWLWSIMSAGALSKLIIAICVLVILGIFAALFAFFRRKLKERQPVDKRTPLERARDTLANLKKETQGKAFSYQLVSLFKSLLGSLSSASLSDLTDSEFIQQIRREKLLPEIIPSLEKILQDSYEVRYAHAVLSESARKEFITLATEILAHIETWQKTKERK